MFSFILFSLKEVKLHLQPSGTKVDESPKWINSFHPADIKGMGGHWKLQNITLTSIVQFKKVLSALCSDKINLWKA